MRVTNYFLILCLCLFACGEQTKSTTNTQPSTQPQRLRIVSTSPSTTELLFALGLGESVVGVTRYCDFPAEATKLPKIGGFTDLNLEAIVGLKPDLVVGSRISNVRPIIEKLTSMKIKTAFPPDDDLSQLYTAIREIGAATGEAEKANKLATEIEGKIQAINTIAKTEAAPRTLVVVGWRPIVVVAQGAFLDSLVQLAGGVNAIQGASVPYPNYDLEAIIRAAPEVIIDASMEDLGADVKARWAPYPDIPAVKNGRVYSAPNQSLLRPGPRLAEGLAAITGLLHPTLKLP
jgi:iron complex transport system substrate-binding protein